MPRLLALYPHFTLAPVPNTAAHNQLITARVHLAVSNSTCQPALLSPLILPSFSLPCSSECPPPPPPPHWIIYIRSPGVSLTASHSCQSITTSRRFILNSFHICPQLSFPTAAIWVWTTAISNAEMRPFTLLYPPAARVICQGANLSVSLPCSRPFRALQRSSE